MAPQGAIFVCFIPVKPYPFPNPQLSPLRMNIVILGLGAIGSLWAANLHKSGHSVAVFTRKTQPSITIQLDCDASIELENNKLEKLAAADLLLVTVKAPQVIDALSHIADKIDPDCMITLMHNGMGTAEEVQQLLPANPLILATTTHGAYRKTANHVSHTGLGTTQLGGYNEKSQQCHFLAEVLQHSLPEVVWNPEIVSALWNKLAINCAINPLTAIEQVTNGTLADDKYRQVLSTIIREVNEVMLAEGIQTSYEQLHSSVFSVIKATEKNLSSMQQDIFHQRQSEIDFITGYLLQRAKAHRIDTPENHALFSAIKQIEQGWNQQ